MSDNRNLDKKHRKSKLMFFIRLLDQFFVCLLSVSTITNHNSNFFLNLSRQNLKYVNFKLPCQFNVHVLRSKTVVLSFYFPVIDVMCNLIYLIWITQHGTLAEYLEFVVGFLRFHSYPWRIKKNLHTLYIK